MARPELCIEEAGLTFRPTDDDESFDVTIGPVTIQLTLQKGQWVFWGIKVGDASQFGGRQVLGPSEFLQWLDAEHAAASDANPGRDA